ATKHRANDIDVESPAPDVWSARGEIPDRASRARAVHQGRGEAELVVHCFEHFLDLASIGDITLESMGDSAAGPDRVDGLARSHLISIEPDRHGESGPAGQATNGCADATGAARHQHGGRSGTHSDHLRLAAMGRSAACCIAGDRKSDGSAM